MHPNIEQLSSNTLVVAGTDSLTLVCLATGYPVPSISWLKDDVPFNSNMDTSLSINVTEFSTRMGTESINEALVSSGFVGNATVQEFLNQYTDISLTDITQLGELGVVSLIRFFNASQENSGSYRCIATNELKTQLRVISQPIDVTVVGNQE